MKKIEKIEQLVKITEVRKIYKVNKKGEKKSEKSVKLTNKLENLIINLKGHLAKNFNEEDQGLKLEITIIIDNKDGDKTENT